jgi:deazaflavin-dependent oxidoreductase (nitroreductase family)
MDQPSGVVRAPVSPDRTLALLRRILRRIWLRVGLAAVLEVPGCRTGTPRQVTIIPSEVGGTLYLMSVYGESDWVRNLRAAGRGQLRRKGRTEAFCAIEVDGDERDRVLAACRAQAAKAPKVFSRDLDQRRGAADHPTFRVDPIR